MGASWKALGGLLGHLSRILGPSWPQYQHNHNLTTLVPPSWPYFFGTPNHFKSIKNLSSFDIILGPLWAPWTPLFSPRRAKRGKGCPNLVDCETQNGSKTVRELTILGPRRALEPARTPLGANLLLGRARTSMFIVCWSEMNEKSVFLKVL